MHNFVYQYDAHEQPKLVDIYSIRVGGFDSDYAKLVEDQGEVIMKIVCSDGVFYLVRKGYRTLKPGEKGETTPP